MLYPAQNVIAESFAVSKTREIRLRDQDLIRDFESRKELEHIPATANHYVLRPVSRSLLSRDPPHLSHILYIIKSLQKHSHSRFMYATDSSSTTGDFSSHMKRTDRQSNPTIDLNTLVARFDSGDYDGSARLFRQDVQVSILSVEPNIRAKIENHFEYLWNFFFPVIEEGRKRRHASPAERSEVACGEKAVDRQSSSVPEPKMLCSNPKSASSANLDCVINKDGLLAFLKPPQTSSEPDHAFNLRYILLSLTKHKESSWLLFSNDVSISLFTVVSKLRLGDYARDHNLCKSDVESLFNNLEAHWTEHDTELRCLNKAHHLFSRLWSYYFPTESNKRKRRSESIS